MSTKKLFTNSLINDRLQFVMSAIRSGYILFFFVMVLGSTQTVKAGGEIILPTSGMRGPHATKEQVQAADASSNIMTAIKFLRDWGLVDEADNIQKWFDNGWLEMDIDISGAETSTTKPHEITLNGKLLLGGGKEASNLNHGFNPADKRDKELIAELAFTLVHEKVHAHQDYTDWIGWGARESNETQAYNHEIVQADKTLEKMDNELNNAINKGDKVQEKELLEWIQAMLTVKIEAIVTFGNNYPDSRKRSWPDRIIEDLRKLQEINRDKLKRFNIDNTGPDPANTEFRTLLGELKVFEESLPARQMPAYWMHFQKNPEPYVETKTDQNLGMITFNTLQGQVIVSLPNEIAPGDTISGSVRTQTTAATSEHIAGNQTELIGYVVEVNGQKTNPSEKNFMFAISDIQKGLVVSLINNKGNKIGSAIVPCNAPQLNVIHPAIITLNDFKIPSVGLRGDQIKITGPFDGNSENTRCYIGGQTVQVIAETPQQMISRSPVDVKGPTTITLIEGNIEKKSEYHNLGLQMSASKMTLIKGERSTLTIQVDGLQELHKKVFLRLECNGIVNMKGGNLQFLEIRPQDVPAGGIWTKTRILTGVQKGTFQVIGSVGEKGP